MSRRAINSAGIAIIKKWESWRSKAYIDDVGVWTIGWGHTSAAGAPRVRSGLTISRAEGERILRNDLGQYEEGVLKGIGYDTPCTDNQFAAMVSLCYNIGAGAFRGSSVARHMRNGSPGVAASKFGLWKKGGGKVLRGLVRRRADEARLFRTADGKRIPPSVQDIATTGAGTSGGVAIVAEGVRDGWLNPGAGIALIIALAIGAGAVLYFRSRKT